MSSNEYVHHSLRHYTRLFSLTHRVVYRAVTYAIKIESISNPPVPFRLSKLQKGAGSSGSRRRHGVEFSMDHTVPCRLTSCQSCPGFVSLDTTAD